MPNSEWCLIVVDLPCLPASAWAAWVQAGGSIAAITIAIAIPLIIHGAERRRLRIERNLRAKSYALALLPGLESFLSNVRLARWRFREIEDGEDFDFISDRLVLPETLSGHQINIHELGLVGSPLQNALARIPHLRVLVNDHEFYARHGGHYHHQDGTEQEIPQPEDAHPLFEEAVDALEAALAAIKAMFNQA